MQGELFEPAILRLREALLSDAGEAAFIVIGCGREKLPRAANARDLYVSPRFRMSVDLAETLGSPYGILSGQHGLLGPDTELSPYDVNLADLSPGYRYQWAAAALKAIRSRAKGRKVTILAVRDYCEPIAELNNSSSEPLDIVFPWDGLEKPDVMLWLSEARRMASRISDLDRLYRWIATERTAGSIFAFDQLGDQKIPARGVYLFLDPAEPDFRSAGPRIIRIGTHAVSAGSKTSLRSRLRNHLGPASEVGSHRGSIFRLHVGRAMLDAEGTRGDLPTWGEGQDAVAEIKQAEAEHERRVSQYLRKLEVALIDVDDEPGKTSMRAIIEMQLIALCSDSMRPIDRPSRQWLGHHSPVSSIRESGLWNIRGVGGRYDPNGAGSVTSIFGA